MKEKTILVVEDEMGPRESLKMILGPRYHVETAENGLKAVEILEKKPVDGVTIDLRMPGPSGIEVLKQIRKRWPLTQVLVITGYATLKTALDAIRYGAFNYLQKPFDVDELIDAVRGMIAKKEALEEMAFLTATRSLSEREEALVSPLLDKMVPVSIA